MSKLNKNEELNKLKNTLVQKVKLENDSHYRNLSADEIMKIIIDSSNKGKYVLWVLREYLKNNIQRFEDMGRVKACLTLFKNNLSKFTEQQKQLNKMSFQELEVLVAPYQNVLTQNAIKRMSKEKIWSEIDIVYNGPEGNMYIPKTQEAAIFLGQGTKWCTAAINDNRFDFYNERGPLYVFVTNKKDDKGREIKYQLHIETEQFMDMEDKKIDLSMCEEFCLFFLNKLSKKDKILLCLRNLEYVNFLELEKELCNQIILEAVKEKGLSIKHVKNPTEKICLEAVKQNGYAIQHIKNPTNEIKLEAVKQTGYAIIYIKNLTDEIKLEAIKQTGMIIEDIQNLTEEMKLEAVKQNGLAIKYISNPTEEMKLLACKSNGYAIRFINNPTDEMKLWSVKENGDAIQYINNPTEEMKLEAVKQNGMVIVRIKNPTEEMCLQACKSDGRSLQYINNPTEEMEIETVKQSGHLIRFIKNPSEKTKLEAVKKYGKSLEYIHNPTYEMCVEAVKQDGNSIIYIPNSTEEMKLLACESNGYAVRHISNPTNEMKLIACKQYGLAIQFIDNPTYEMCFKAVKQNAESIKHIKNPPQELKLMYFDYLFKKNDINLISKITPNNIEEAEYCFNKSQNNIILKHYFQDIFNDFQKNDILNPT